MKREKFNKIFKSIYAVQNPDELFWLINILEKLKPTGIIEIGVEAGGSLRFWLEVLSEGSVLVGIDLKIQEKVRIMAEPIAKEKGIDIHLIEGRSENHEIIKDVWGILKSRKVDFLFIDAEHTVEVAKRDFENYSAFVRGGGIVAFHDIDCVGGFLETLKGKKDSKTRWTGTGIWWKYG